jgi:hypothetical protein
VPDLDHLREWLEKMVAAMKFVELVIAVMSLITRMRDINLELTKRVAHLTRKRPPSETLERLERQLALPWSGLVGKPGVTPVGSLAVSGPKGETPKLPKSKRKPSTRNEFPAHLKRVPVPNPVPQDQRICPLCGTEMNTVGHSVPPVSG